MVKAEIPFIEHCKTPHTKNHFWQFIVDLSRPVNIYAFMRANSVRTIRLLSVVLACLFIFTSKYITPIFLSQHKFYLTVSEARKYSFI